MKNKIFKSSGFIASQEKFLKVKKWRINCLSANCTEDIRSKKLKQELQESKKKIKVLETELVRKDKVLAEITALLKLCPTFRTFTPKNTISSL